MLRKTNPGRKLASPPPTPGGKGRLAQLLNAPRQWSWKVRAAVIAAVVVGAGGAAYTTGHAPGFVNEIGDKAAAVFDGDTEADESAGAAGDRKAARGKRDGKEARGKGRAARRGKKAARGGKNKSSAKKRRARARARKARRERQLAARKRRNKD